MPHVNGGGGGEDLASSDEFKVYKHEGEEREEKASDNLTEDKTDLVIQGEEEKCTQIAAESCSSPKNVPIRTEAGSVVGKSVDAIGHDRSLNMGYIVTPYPYPNGTAGPIPVSMISDSIHMVVVSKFIVGTTKKIRMMQKK